jgi:hypothetical protein
MPFLALIVTLLAIGASVLLGVLGHLIEENSEREEHNSEGNRG